MSEPADLHQIAYVSRSTVASGDAEAVVQDILATARRKNPAAGLTGALLFSDGYFAQVLEGPIDPLELTFEAIQEDTRHDEVRVLFYRAVPARAFSDWSMAFAGAVDASALSDTLRSSFGSAEALDAPKAGKDLLQVLDRLIDRSEAVRRLRG